MEREERGERGERGGGREEEFARREEESVICRVDEEFVIWDLELVGRAEEEEDEREGWGGEWEGREVEISEEEDIDKERFGST